VAGYREFQTGEVLTAANVNDFLMNQAVMVFADATARTSALSGVLAEGMLTYNLDTQSLEVYDGSAFVAVGGAMKEKRIEAFTGSGNWTVPAGVTYAIAHMRGGGGGIAVGGSSNDAGAGGSSTVDFASGLVTALGGAKAATYAFTNTTLTANAGPNNSGRGANGAALGSSGPSAMASAAGQNAMDGAVIVAAAAVTPAAVIAVVVGAGGTAGTSGAAGGSGYVYIEYYEEV
jgi:hypothetical protein